MGKEWVRTPEQEAYLEGEFQNYLKARNDREVKNWRSKLHNKWEERWPECQVLINEWKLPDNTPFNTAQMETLGKALTTRKTVRCILNHISTFIQFFFLANIQLHPLAHRCKTSRQKKPTEFTHSLHPQAWPQETKAEAYTS